jgi:GMP synthase-like glutamine amidotransferase
VEHNLPVLGVCLGSQLIAKAFGANVYNGTKKEIGFFHDLILENQNSSNLFTGITNPFTVFHWHEETFALPDGAMRLASSNSYPNQAFKIGTAVGLQFHIEVDDAMINLWLDKTKTLPTNVKEKIRNDIEKNIPILKQNLNHFYRNFKKEFLTTKV